MSIKPVEDKANKRKIKTGVGYECVENRKKGNPKYECTFTLTTVDVAGETLRGKVKEFKTIAHLDSAPAEIPVTNATNAYSGTLVTILRESPNIAVLKGKGSATEKFLDGTKASYEAVFNRLKEKNPGSDPNVAEGLEVKCVKDPAATEPYTCEMRFNVETGQPIEVKNWI